ncbi:MAG: DUF1269 domain-containing protein [Anaerolineae bacterium]|nr:DUF1269 domain-containing protein [Anaerolineae bacterium]
MMSRDVTIDVLIAGYLNRELALLDYQAVLDSGAKYEGVVCMHRDLEGNTSIEETDHLKRGGAKALGAAGFVVGLFAPPLLLTTAVGAAFGAGVGQVAHSKVKSKLEEQAAQTIPWGGAGLIVAYPHERPKRLIKQSPVPCGKRLARRKAPRSMRSKGRWPMPSRRWMHRRHRQRQRHNRELTL